MNRDEIVRVIDLYTEKVWNQGDPAAMAEFVSDPCLRHEIGGLVEVPLVENQARLVEAHAALADLDIVNVRTWADGEYVTSCYVLSFGPPDERETISGIEVFRVQDGKISEVWNAPTAPGAWA